jgi:hypothetical protein
MAWSNAVGWNNRRGWNNRAGGGGGGGGSFATWDPTDFIVADTFGNARVQLTNSNLTATEFNASGGSVIITANRAVSGKCRFEVTASTGINVGLSLANIKSSGNGSFLGGGDGGLGWLPDGRVFIAFANQGTVAPTYASGDVCGVEIDLPNKLAYFVVNGGSRLPVGGVDISGMAGSLYPASDLGTVNAQHAVANFGGAAWGSTATAGYGAIP